MSRQYDDDDGRTIVSMDVEGMPWYDKRIKREQREQARRERAERSELTEHEEVLTKRQTARWIWHSLLAAFLVLLVIGGGLVLLIFIEWVVWKLKTGA